jgi:hypothetical protein
LSNEIKRYRLKTEAAMLEKGIFLYCANRKEALHDEKVLDFE